MLWDDLTAGTTRSLHTWVGQSYDSTPWADVVRDAERMTAGLRRAGVGPGTRVATILTNTGASVRGILATWLAGGCLASFPLPARGLSPEEYATQLRTLCSHLEPAAMFLDEAIVGLLPEDLRAAVNARSWESVAGSGAVEPSPPGADDVAFVQFSSGSTSLPKGSMLTPRAISAQLGIIGGMLGLERSVDVCASWLPLSHDMGIFGCLLAPWVHDMDLWLSTPERFTVAPGSWLGDAAEVGATRTCGTNTALALAARRLRNRGLSAPLRLRTVILGAERIEWPTLTTALAALEGSGLTAEALMPAYGLAEATLAVTATPQPEAPRFLTVDGVALADAELREVAEDDPVATRIVSSGVPCAGVEVSTEDTRVSEITVRSASLATGYLGDPARTADRFVDGGFRTGDLGFVRDGYLYPVGRLDDILSIGGRKVYAREIEAAVDDLDGIRRGCSALVSTHDGRQQRLTLLVEARSAGIDLVALADRAAELAMSKAGVVIDRFLVLPKGTVPKTPSGKIQRYRCRELLAADRLESVRTIELSR
jgi:fatty-acyl-CoA synthase